MFWLLIVYAATYFSIAQIGWLVKTAKKTWSFISFGKKMGNNYLRHPNPEIEAER